MHKSLLSFGVLAVLIAPVRVYAAFSVNLNAVSEPVTGTVRTGSQDVHLASLHFNETGGGGGTEDVTQIILRVLDAPAVLESTNVCSVWIYTDQNAAPSQGGTKYGATAAFHSDVSGTTFFNGTIAVANAENHYAHVYCDLGRHMADGGNIRIEASFAATAEGTGDPTSNTTGLTVANPPPDNDGVLIARRFGNIGGMELSWQPGTVDSADADSFGIWYDTSAAGGFPDSVGDPSAVLVGTYAFVDSIDTVYFAKALHNETLYFAAVVRDSGGNWSDTALSACDTAVVNNNDNTPPDNDGWMTAKSAAGTGNIEISWSVAAIDSPDADSVGIWFKTTDFPDSAYDQSPGVVLAGKFPVAAGTETVSVAPAYYDTLYFSMVIRDVSGNWSDTLRAACDTAVAGDKVGPDNDLQVSVTPLSHASVQVSWYPAAVDSADAESVLVFYKTSGVPTGPADPGAIRAGGFAMADSADTVTGLAAGTEYYFIAAVKDSSGNWSPVPDGATDSARTLSRWTTMVFREDYEFKTTGVEPPAGWAVSSAAKSVVHACDTTGLGRIRGRAGRYERTGNPAPTLTYTFGDMGGDSVVLEWDYRKETNTAAVEHYWQSSGAAKVFDLQWGADGLLYLNDGGGYAGTGFGYNGGQTYRIRITSNLAESDSFDLFIDDMAVRQGRYQRSGTNATLGQVIFEASATGEAMFFDNLLLYRVDITPPDNDGILKARGIADNRIEVAWQPGSIDSSDADSVGLWYDTTNAGGYPDFAFDPGAVLLGVYALADSVDTFSFAAGLQEDTLSFAIAVRDSAGNWSDTALAACDTAVVPPDTRPPDNDVALAAAAGRNKSVVLSWTPGSIDSVDADSMAVWYKAGDYPDSAYDATATLLAKYGGVATAADTLHSATPGSTYYFMLFVRDAAGNWSDSSVSGGAFAVPVDTMAPDNDVALSAAAGTNKSVVLSWAPGNIDSADADSMAVWYKVGDYPDSAYDATATLLAKYGDVTTAADTLHYATPGSTYYFMLFVRDTSGNWSDSSVSGGASAVPVDTMAPDNDVTLTASAFSKSAVALSWNPAAIGSTDADSVGIWFKKGDYPDSAHDVTASQVLVLPVAAALGTLNTGLTHSTTYYFSFVVRDTSGNWSDTALTACDTARTHSTASWWNAAWHCRQELSFNNQASDSSLHDFTVLVKLHGGRIDYGLVRDDGADLRFIDADDATPLDFEIESWDESGTSYVWVEVPRVDSQSTADSIWLYYNNPGAADVQDTAGTWNAGYAGVWHFGESGAGSRMDATSNSNDGTPAGYDGNEKVIGRTGQADYLDGGDDYISFSDVPFDFTDNFSVSAWMRTGDTGNDWARMIDKLNRWDTGWGLGGKSGAGYGFTAYWSGGWGGDPAASFGAVSDGSWHYVTAVVEGGVVRTYTDGVLVATYATRAGQSITTNNNALLFGKSSNAAAYWTGSLDEVRISSVVRDSNWIYAQHASMIDTFIDWASASPVLDEYQPPDNDMTLTATALTESSVVLAWNPSSIDSADAYRVGIWYKTTDYPDSANDVTATLLGYYSLNTAADTVTSGLSSGTSYYFTVTVQDSSGNWAAVTGAGSDMATTPFKAWWDLDWLNRQQLTFRNQAAAEDLTGVPVMVKLYHPRIDTAKTANDGSDLRFVAPNNITPLDYEIETWDEAGTSYVWVEVPSVSAGSNADYIWMYYNNDGAADAQDTAGTWNAGYASVFHLNASVTDEGSADSAWHDATSNGNHASQRGTDDAGARAAAGSQYDGTDDFDSTSQDLNQWLGQGAQATLAAWIRTSQTGNASTWLAPGITGIEQNGGSDDIFWGWIDAAGLIGITAGNGTSVKSTTAINDGGWHHVAFTRVAATGAVEVYVDGIREGNGNSDTGTKSNAFYSLGRIEDTGGTPVYFNGTLDEVRISSTRRSGDWIYAQHASMIDTFIDWGTAVEDEADTLPPDNDGVLTATGLADGTRRIALSWQPGSIDSADAYVAGIWYFTGGADGYPDSAYDPGATLVGIYAMSDSADTVTIPGGAADDTVYFTLLLRDTTGNWCDTAAVACDTTVAPDILAPDNDVTLTASALTCTSVTFSWNPALIDSADADSVGIWAKTGDFPDSAHDAGALSAGFFPVAAGAGTSAVGLHPGTAYYFSLTVRDSAGNWADTALAACDTAQTAPGTLAVSGAAMGPGPVSPGDENVDMLKLVFFAMHETVYVDTVILHVENTADTSDLDTVALYADNGGTADTMIPGTFAFAGSLGAEIVIMLVPSDSLVVPRGETLRVHVVADIKAGADAAHIVNITVDSSDSLRVRGQYSGRSEAVSGAFPVQSGDVTLPVELASFSAYQAGPSVLLAWRTASETDNLGYYVYRSRWQEGPYQRLNADLIRGAVNSETGSSYAFTDSTLRSAGTFWYKLTDVDIAGAQTYHGPVAVPFVPPGTGTAVAVERMALYGNPVSAGSVLRFRTAARGVTRIVVYDDEGSRISESRYGLAGSGGAVTLAGGRLLDMLDRREGMYLIELHTRDAVERIRVLYLR